jgi:hypothetical protein
MAIRVFWAEPGPKAEEALRHYWAIAHEIAADIISRKALEKAPATPQVAEERLSKPKEPGQ